MIEQIFLNYDIINSHANSNLLRRYVMSKKAVIGIFFTVLVVIISVFSLIKLNNTSDNYDTISKYVNENYQMLEQIANEYINGSQVKKPKNVSMIEVHSQDDIYVKNNNTIVEFYTGGKGLVSSSTYYGFYYSKDDIPASFQNSDEELVEYKANKWKWNGTGDNHGKTIKIRDNWFYFEASF